jgi:Ca2+/Na+ antiporter
MHRTLEERKLQYIETVMTGFPVTEKSWWQNPVPAFHLTGDLAAKHIPPVIAGEPVIFKKPVKERIVATVLLVTAFLLLILLGKNDMGFWNIIALLVLLVIILPVLLRNKATIRISREGIWLYKEEKNIPWENIVITGIREIHTEDASYDFVLHYYDQTADEFRPVEMPLHDWISPGMLAATIEAYRPAKDKENHESSQNIIL